MAMAPDDAKAIEAAFGAAQAQDPRAARGRARRTASGEYALPPLLWSGAVALATPWPLLLFTHLSAERIFTAQLALCLVALACFSCAPIRIALTPRRARRAHAHRAALVQFAVRGLRSCARAQWRADLCLARRTLCANRRRRGREPNHQRRAMAAAGRRLIPDLPAKGADQALGEAAARMRGVAGAAISRPIRPACASGRAVSRNLATCRPSFGLVLRTAPFVFTRRRRNSPAGPSHAPRGDPIEHGLSDIYAAYRRLALATLFVLWRRRSPSRPLSRRRRGQRPDPDRESGDRALVSRFGDQADDDLCRAQRGARGSPDHGYAAHRIDARGAHGRPPRWASIRAPRSRSTTR